MQTTVEVKRTYTLTLTQIEFNDIRNAIASGIMKHTGVNSLNVLDITQASDYTKRWYAIWRQLEISE